MDQNRRPTHKPMHLQPTDPQQKNPKHPMQKKTASSTHAAGKTVYPYVEDWNYIPVFHPVQKSIQSETKTLISALKHWNNSKK
jgi:hypothetical protein